jgi:hypothetical protein
MMRRFIIFGSFFIINLVCLFDILRQRQKVVLNFVKKSYNTTLSAHYQFIIFTKQAHKEASPRAQNSTKFIASRAKHSMIMNRVKMNIT